jgi:RNA-directed DNA polymerase
VKTEDLPGVESQDESRGTPQGGVISPLLANIYLDPLDWLMAGLGFEMVRYADDMVVMCRSRGKDHQRSPNRYFTKLGLFFL